MTRHIRITMYTSTRSVAAMALTDPTPTTVRGIVVQINFQLPLDMGPDDKPGAMK